MNAIALKRTPEVKAQRDLIAELKLRARLAEKAGDTTRALYLYTRCHVHALVLRDLEASYVEVA